MKVYGGLSFKNGEQVRTIVAAKSAKEAAQLLGISLYHLNDYWCAAHDQNEIEVALGKPGTVFEASSSVGHDFTEVVA